MAVSAAEIAEKAIELGYDKCGMIPVEMMRGHEAKLEERMEHFPETRRKYEGFRKFAYPEKEFPWAKAIVIVSFWYGKYRIPAAVRGHIAKYYLTDGRRNPDSQGYKAGAALEKYLRDSGLRVAFNRDFALTALRWAAMQAGIGIVRKTISSIRKRARISIWKRSLSMSRCSSQRRASFGPARSPAICVYAPVLRTRSKHRIR